MLSNRDDQSQQSDFRFQIRDFRSRERRFRETSRTPGRCRKVEIYKLAHRLGVGAHALTMTPFESPAISNRESAIAG
jgi:hypothetical protein